MKSLHDFAGVLAIITLALIIVINQSLVWFYIPIPVALFAVLWWVIETLLDAYVSTRTVQP